MTRGHFKKGYTPWNKGIKGIYKRKVHEDGKAFSKESRENMSKAHRGRKFSEDTRRKMSLARTGQVRSLEARKKMSESKKGEKNPLWKGGASTINARLRGSLEYKLWRKAVFERDNYTCIWCGDNSGGNLNADHIKPFAYYPELRFAIDNGRTLCVSCHQTTDTFARKTKPIEYI